ncbi:MAG: 3'-5' exonuclease [Firmicutes bacterium]|nr:3'-5' exonuclease [Bacillota bacterium]
MFPHHYFEADCHALNCRARLNYPWQRRLTDFFRHSFFNNLNYWKRNPSQNKKLMAAIISKIEELQQEICWEQDLQAASYAVFDCETTGFEPLKGDKIISLGGIIIEDGNIIDKQIFNQLVNPLRPIPPAITALTGITNSMVAGKPTICQVLLDFLDFLGNKILIAHRAPFDLTFLNLELGRFAPVRIPQPVIDTHLLSCYILPWLEEHTLDYLGTCHNIKMKQRHTALGDAKITARVFLKLLQRLKKEGISTLGQLRDYFLLKKTADAPLTISVASF